MSGAYASTLFRVVFALAGAYNLAFGLWAGFHPAGFFELFDIALPRYPQIWSCAGMVVGVYGLLYWHAAWKLDRARPIIAVGLLGKVLGPIGMVMSFSPAWPQRLGLLSVYNDVIWWLPFVLFLLRGRPLGARVAALAPWCCAGVHVTGLFVIAFVLRSGTEVEPRHLERAVYIVEHASLWRLGWSIWIVAAMSLVGFYAWWGSHVTFTPAAVLAPLLAAAGMVCDLSGEFMSSLVLVERAAGAVVAPDAWDASLFVGAQRTATLLTAGAANGLYTAGGVLLTLNTPKLPRWAVALMWTTWFSGAGMTVSALTGSTSGMVAATACLFPVFTVWNVWMALRWRG